MRVDKFKPILITVSGFAVASSVAIIAAVITAYIQYAKVYGFVPFTVSLIRYFLK